MQFKLKKLSFENMDYAAVYVQPTNLHGMVKAHYKRPIVKVTCNGKIIYRKLRAKAIKGLDAETVGIDYISIMELGTNDDDLIQIEKARFPGRFISYFVKHPNEDIRTGWICFALSLLISLLGLIITLIK